MNAWHALVPLPQASGYALDPQEHVVRTQEFEAGPGDARQRYSVPNDIVEATIKMTGRQLTIFRTWYRHDTGARWGHGWFEMGLLVDGVGLVTVQARFASIWKAELRDRNQWIVATKFELRY